MEDFIESTVVASSLRNGRIYFSASLASFFPANSLGERSGSGPHGVPITIVVGADEMDTDIRRSSGRRISPRRSFARWLRSVSARDGDRLRLTRIGDRRYRLELVAPS